MRSTSHLDDDDDLDDDNIPGFTHPALAQAPKTPLDKGKGAARYEPEQLAAPTVGIRGEGSSNLSGDIGSSSQPQRGPNRQTLGGVQVETR